MDDKDSATEPDEATVDGVDATAEVSGRGLRRRFADKTPRERGVVLIWFAMLLIVLLGFAGFAVDLSNWWLQADKLQRAADAGAHAGVVYLPADLANATSTARAEVTKNGYTLNGGGANATVHVSQEPNPNRLRVRVTTTVDNYFVKLLGIPSVTLNREAVAEYIAPVPMGSPENRLGNDPEIDYNPQLWSMVGGPNSWKHWGDRYQAKECLRNSTYFESNCMSGAVEGVENDDYAKEGYLYAIEVTNPVAGQPLRVQIYDPAFVDIGSSCPSNMLPSDSQRSALQSKAGNPYPDAVSRYAPGTGKWCSGDIDHEGANVNTSYVVRAPDSTEWTDLDNPVIDTATCSPQSFKPYDPSNGTAIYNWLNSGAESVMDGQAPWTFAEVFRKWVTVCEIPSGSVQTGKYILQIRTNATAADPTTYNASVSTGGHNRFSIRAGFGTTGLTQVSGANLTISARGRLPLFTNADAADAEFFLARVLPYDAGRTLRISLFDMGDVSGGAGSLQILPPSEYASSFSGCSFVRDGGGTLSTQTNICKLNNVSAANGYQGKIVTIDVPIPESYTCNTGSVTGCWVKVLASFPGGVNDVTTWSAAILGNPIRLVE